MTCQSQDLFNTKLPYEITVYIFQYLNRSDCLRSLAVSRNWFAAVPTYAQDIWSDIRIHGTDKCLYEKLWMQFIGNHVKHISLTGFHTNEALFSIMEKLIDHGCTQLKSLTFDDCMTSNHKLFVQLMCQMGEHITDLTFDNHRSNMAITHTIKACPKLNQFHFTTISDFIDIRAVQRINTSGFISVRSGPPLPDYFEHLTELWIGVPLQKAARVEPLLQMCPNLLYLGYVRDRLIYPAIVNLDDLFTWCPKLIYVEINTRDFGTGPFQLERRTLFRRIYDDDKDSISNKEDALVCFIAQEVNWFTSEEITPHLVRNASTLKCLALGSHNYYGQPVESDWTAKFHTTLCLSHLHTLILEYIHLQSDALVAMVQRCPGLQILIISQTVGSISLNIPQLLEPLKQLKHLEISNIPVSFFNGRNDSAIQTFQHWIASYNNGSGDSKIKKGPEEIHLNLTEGVPSDLLTAITYITTLKRFSCTFTCESMHDELSTMADRFKLLTYLESLCFRRARGLSFDFFCSLSELPYLTTFYAAHSNPLVVDDAGLMHLLSFIGKDHPRLKKISIDCPSFSERGVVLDSEYLMNMFHDLLDVYHIDYSSSHTLTITSK
ncbi:hypothetical protein BDA99DRAFT_539007 [Phascolomyces articulosus]|uniref:F-box domain-containing protein n=1 Tax=Phascolomyces articulosus TaxID=60185 RepID=A0AAD5K628_9FUNG|nr:hypothetical protein BDA99DRAFT_539007 [Phascolomyces articulosus]